MQRIVRDQFLEPTDGTEVIILGKLHRTAELSRKIAVNVRNPCASAGDVNTLFLDMIVDLRRCTLQRMLEFLADLINTGKECFVYEGRSNDPFHWKTGCTIYAAHLPRLFFVCSKIRQRNLDTFGCFGANLEIVFAAVQIAYRFVELFSAYRDDSGKITLALAITEISVLCAPMLTIMEPFVRLIGMPSASASAIGLSTRYMRQFFKAPLCAIV